MIVPFGTTGYRVVSRGLVFSGRCAHDFIIYEYNQLALGPLELVDVVHDRDIYYLSISVWRESCAISIGELYSITADEAFLQFGENLQSSSGYGLRNIFFNPC